MHLDICQIRVFIPVKKRQIFVPIFHSYKRPCVVSLMELKESRLEKLFALCGKYVESVSAVCRLAVAENFPPGRSVCLLPLLSLCKPTDVLHCRHKHALLSPAHRKTFSIAVQTASRVFSWVFFFTCSSKNWTVASQWGDTIFFNTFIVKKQSRIEMKKNSSWQHNSLHELSGCLCLLWPCGEASFFFSPSATADSPLENLSFLRRTAPNSSLKATRTFLP